MERGGWCVGVLSKLLLFGLVLMGTT
jgi:hypothetical protein